MKTALFSARPYDQRFFDEANARHDHELAYFQAHLEPETARLAEGYPAVCAFVNDRLDRAILEQLKQGGTQLIALRSAGYNHVDLAAAAELALTVVRVPAYSPHAVAEHTVGLMLALDRKIHRAHARVRDGNLSLDGLLGFDLQGKTVGIVGTGQIGAVVARILLGFGCRVLACDPVENGELASAGVRYVTFDYLLCESRIVTLHCPLTPDTHHLIDAAALARMNTGVMLINTSRGPLIDTRAVIAALKTRRIGYLGLDVYEEEGDLFFEDLSNKIITDDVFSRLLTFPNVLITGHQAFFTAEALAAIAETTLANISVVARGEPCANEIRNA